MADAENATPPEPSGARNSLLTFFARQARITNLIALICMVSSIALATISGIVLTDTRRSIGFLDANQFYTRVNEQMLEVNGVLGVLDMAARSARGNSEIGTQIDTEFARLKEEITGMRELASGTVMADYSAPLDVLEAGIEDALATTPRQYVEIRRLIAATADDLVILSIIAKEGALAETENVKERQRASLRKVVVVTAIGIPLALLVSIILAISIRRRVSRVAAAMNTLTRGDFDIELQPAVCRDQIGDMTDAVFVFRNTLIERKRLQDELQKSHDELEQRVIERTEEIAAARQRLVDAIASSSEGIAFYDSDDRLELFNERFKELLYSGADADIPIGATFEEIIQGVADHGLIETGDDDIENIVKERIRRHLDPGKPFLQHRADGKWIQISERRTSDGGIVAVYSDLTELKANEEQAKQSNQLIMESLRYASRIQRAMLPSREAFVSGTPEHFLIWEPRDVVGGDFYWHHATDAGQYIIIGDCTGHGVPGGFMTLIACGFLDRILRESEAVAPGDLLARLHTDLRNILGQTEKSTDTDDGLEMGVCFVVPQNKSLQFAGSRFSLWHSSGDVIREIRGDKAGIGYFRTGADAAFTNHTVEISDGDRFYMATDGLIDQIGGPKRISFGKRRFREVLADSADGDLKSQGKALWSAFQEYQGEENRRDDLTVLGFMPGNALRN